MTTDTAASNLKAPSGKKLFFAGAIGVLAMTLKLFDKACVSSLDTSFESSERLSSVLNGFGREKNNTQSFTISYESLEQFEKDGYAVLPNLLPTEVVQELYQLTVNAGILEDKRGSFQKLVFGGGIAAPYVRASWKFQPLADLFFNAEPIASAAKQLLGGSRVHYASDILFRKPKGENGGNWHRDDPLVRVVEDDDAVTLWIPLTPSSTGGTENGSLVLAKGSHKWKPSDGCTARADTGGRIQNKDLDGYDECVEKLDSVAVPLPPMQLGDAVAFRPTLYHRTAGSKDLIGSRIATSIFLVSDQSMYRQDQSKFQCIFKPPLATMLESSDVEFLSDALPELSPHGFQKRFKEYRDHTNSYFVAATRDVIFNTVLSCKIKQFLGISGTSYHEIN